MSRNEKSKQATQMPDAKKLAPKKSVSSAKSSGELNDEQLERISGGAMAYSYHTES